LERCADAFSKPGTASRGRYAIGLHRVSTTEQEHSGPGLEAQRASMRVYVAQVWQLVTEHEDVATGKDDHRPGFQAALARL
jgi:DNA invertase Pin-like site-specific DNA recombinase